MMTSALSIFFLAVSLVSSAPGKNGVVCPEGVLFLPDPDDCSKYYMCHDGVRFDFSCDKNVWDAEVKTCVGRGSQWDKCTNARQLTEINSVESSSDPCSNSNNAIFAKSDNCAQYYDCSSEAATVTSDPHLKECSFPQLFNEETKRCEHYTMVKCGSRVEPKDGCEYVANQCQRAHCIPCNVRFPACKNKADGLNPWEGREYSPYYVVCLEQRAVYQGMCDNSKGTQLFDPDKRMCTEMKTPQ